MEEVEGLFDLVLRVVVVHVDEHVEHPRLTDKRIDLRVDVLELQVHNLDQIVLLEVLEQVLVDGIPDHRVHVLVDPFDLVVHVIDLVLDLLI